MNFKEFLKEESGALIQKMRDGVKKEFEKQKSRGKSDKDAWNHASSTRDGTFLGKKQRDILKKELLGESMAIGTQIDSAEQCLEEGSTRDYVDNILPKSLKKAVEDVQK